VVLLTHDSFALSDDVIARFEAQSSLSLRILRAGDAGAVVNQAILSRSHPLGDVLFGVDNTFLSRALAADLFEAYQSPALRGVPAELQLDPQGRVTPVDFGDVCLNVDRRAFAAGSPPAPERLEDLTDPAYRGQLVVENPATSSTGLAFMLATVARFGESGDPGWLDYWSQLRANDVLVSASWDDAYQTQFSGSAGHGSRPIVVSYASSPVAEVYYSNPQISEPPTAAVLDGCFRQVELAGVLAGAANPAGARALVDFLLSPEAQADIPLQMFVFPVVKATPLPDVFRSFARVPSEPLSLDPATIEANRDRWIDEWTKTVLR
jgi:thiamine transport system substrate-binding protein